MRLSYHPITALFAFGLCALPLGCVNQLGPGTDPSGTAPGATPGAPGGPGQTGTDGVPARPGVDSNGDGKPDEPGPEPEDTPAEPVMMASTKNDLAWKRVRAVEQDLLRGLALDEDELCNELGTYNCTSIVHLSPLGGNEPFNSGQYRPAPAPTATTALALSRTVLSACAVRVEKDRNGSPVVFTAVNLDENALDNDDDATLDAVDATTRTLHRRLLSRDPTDAEVNAVRELLHEGDGAGSISGSEFATLACYAIGTTAENIFY